LITIVSWLNAENDRQSMLKLFHDCRHQWLTKSISCSFYSPQMTTSHPVELSTFPAFFE
jgi:hypothetical protein